MKLNTWAPLPSLAPVLRLLKAVPNPPMPHATQHAPYSWLQAAASGTSMASSTAGLAVAMLRGIGAASRVLLQCGVRRVPVASPTSSERMVRSPHSVASCNRAQHSGVRSTHHRQDSMSWGWGCLVLAITASQVWPHLGLWVRDGSCRSLLWWLRSLLHAGCKCRGGVSTHVEGMGWASSWELANLSPAPTIFAIPSLTLQDPKTPPAPQAWLSPCPLPPQPGILTTPHTPSKRFGSWGSPAFSQNLSSGGCSHLLVQAAWDARLGCEAAAGAGSTTRGGLSHGPSLGMFFLLTVGA